ncbi:hypothetical protein [Streptomyces halobius]|uniref:Uncharacterized protein n=1 Tax=Streptomyces halobius TaxID=2879846 RepID=A0ABY4M065_9ACTN|nr:hypothetical protein [Streptomyces halobius]UQA91137.1 hypothetical protein K9S39_03860 [Streptomyces halobius]
MTDVLTWTVERRLQLAERAELLRKELAEIDAEVARLKAAEVVFGQWAEATDGGRHPVGIVEPEPKRVVAGPGAGGMRLVPDRTEGTGLEMLPPEYRRIMEIVAGAAGPVMAKDVATALAGRRHRRRSSRSAGSCASSPTGAGWSVPGRAAICRADHWRRHGGGLFLPYTRAPGGSWSVCED